MTIEDGIIELITQQGPLSGQRIVEHLGGDKLAIWQACRRSHCLDIRTIGTRYLRFDRRIAGLSRLSPSILREFLTYSMIGLAHEPALLLKRASELGTHIEGISRAKSEFIYHVIAALADNLKNRDTILDQSCFILAGDIVYHMAHDVPRPERSTGKLVKGSDIDLVVIVDDHLSPDLVKALDDAIFQEKYRLLITPHIREEIDYVVKNLTKVYEQVQFDTFKHMVACKILQEGTYLFGNKIIFEKVKEIMHNQGLFIKLKQLYHQAEQDRVLATEVLLNLVPENISDEEKGLFYPSEESEEFE